MCAKLTSEASLGGLRVDCRNEGAREGCVGAMRALVGGWWADNEGWRMQ
jgi:hypothetical protein